MNQHTTTGELLEVVFSVWSVLKLYNEDQLQEASEKSAVWIGAWDVWIV
jgi:hypothetical protein